MPLLLIPLILIGVCAASFRIWMLVDCLTNQNLSGSQRCCWALFILCAHLVGALVYAIVLRSSQTTPLVPVSQASPHLYRKLMPPEAFRPYQEGYPIQHARQDGRIPPENVAIERPPMQPQARYEEIQISYAENPH